MREINRKIAKSHYAEFSKKWREALRETDRYGTTGSPKRPTFNQWFEMHERDLNMTKLSTPTDVAQYIQPTLQPWTERPYAPEFTPEIDGSTPRRGVETIDMGKSDLD